MLSVKKTFPLFWNYSKIQGVPQKLPCSHLLWERGPSLLHSKVNKWSEQWMCLSCLSLFTLPTKEYQRLVRSYSQGRDYAQLNNKETGTQKGSDLPVIGQVDETHILNVFGAPSIQNNYSKYSYWIADLLTEEGSSILFMYLRYDFSLKEACLCQK